MKAKEAKQQEELFENLLKAPINVTLDQILNIVPTFKTQLMAGETKNSLMDNALEVECKLEGEENAIKAKQVEYTDLQEELEINLAQVEDVDYSVPVIPLEYKRQIIPKVLLDGGSSVNIIFKELYKKFCLNEL